MKKINFLLGVIICFSLSCCTEIRISNNYFKSNFNEIDSQIWLGQDYWSNPLQDWQISNDRIECLVSSENRNVHLLTRRLSDTLGHLEMTVQMGFFNKNTSLLNKNWAGFSIGSKGKFSDFRDNAIYGEGLNIGITTNGSFFIGDPIPNGKNEDIIDNFSDGLILKLKITSVKKRHISSYIIDFTILSADTKRVLGSISKYNVSPENLIGDLVLVSHFENEEESNRIKSVWFKDWEVKGDKVAKCEECSFGPIMFSQYTLSRGTLKLTAQMAPVNLAKNKLVELQLKKNNSWKTIQTSTIDKDARTATFKVDNWEESNNIPYRIVYNLNIADSKLEEHHWEGTIRKNPKNKDEIIVAGFTGNNDLGFPNTDIVEQVEFQDPDILFFSGDQIYEEVGGYYITMEPIDVATLDYLRKWFMYGWAYRNLLKDRPTVVITDDHDVYMGNVWGESGKSTIQNGTRKEIQDSGGYRMPPSWVNMVQRTQTSHLPDPYDPTPVLREIGVYYTQMNYGGISFAILEDRKFKSAPKGLLPEANVENGWPLNKSFDMKNADVNGAILLGDRQLSFLENWASDWSFGAQMKTVLSQTIFANVATLPQEAMTDAIVPTLRILKENEYPDSDLPVTDMDSNGWPQSGRNNALKTIRKGYAFHLAGDQHLGSTIQYGVDDFQDSGYAFCVPSISNYWPRRWYPSYEGQNRIKSTPKYTGDYLDGFGNKMTVLAISNPLFTNKKPSELYDRAAGYGIVRFNKKDRTIRMESWPRNADPKNGDSEQYKGWPITISQFDNFAQNSQISLPTIKVTGLNNPVVQIIDEENNTTVAALRILGSTFTPKVLKQGNYTVRVSEPDQNLIKEIKSISTIKGKHSEINFKF